MSPLKRITLAAAIACACLPAAAHAHSLADHVPSSGHEYQDLRGADAKGDPESAAEFPDFVPAPRVRVVEVPSPGIDWADATIGAGGMLVVALLTMASGLMVVRRRAAI